MTQNGQNFETPYRVLARKYRPQNFDDLIGQEPMVRTLTNAFRTGRIAQAYMLTGVRGVGKTTTARILARALNYRREGMDQPNIDVREEGEHCRAILEGRHVDVIEMDAASHTGIDNMRDILDSVRYAPAIARYKVYIIDEVHQLSSHSFNALLKTLEEPPPHLKFIFATTEIRKVPVTVLSRCQRFDLRRIDADTLAGHLRKIGTAEGVAADDEALALIARAAEGSVRDALSIFDQAIAHSAGAVAAHSVRTMLGLADRGRVIDLFAQVMAGDISAALAEIKDQYDTGASPSVVLTDLAEFVHFVTRLKFVPATAQDRSLTETERLRGTEFCTRLSVRALDRAWKILLKGIAEVEGSERPLAAADMVLVRLAHAATLPFPEDLLRKLSPANGETAIAASSGPRSVGDAEPGGAARQETRGAGVPESTQMQEPIGLPAPRAMIVGASSPVEKPAGMPASPGMELGRFEDLVLLAEEKREIRLRTMLRTNVRLISFRDGRMEFAIAGNPPPSFVSDLGQKLFAWTGRRWTVIVNREGGAATLDELEKAELGERTQLARNDPVVEAVLTRFPGSRIVDVKMRDELALQADDSVSPEQPGEGSDDQLD